MPPRLITDILVVTAALLALVASRRLSSGRLFQVATVAFGCTAASLFLELTARGGLAARLGWYGILVAGPLAIALVVLALIRYSREQETQETRDRRGSR